MVALIALLAAPAAAASTFTLKPGQGIYVSGTPIVCTYGGRAGSTGGLGCRVQSSSGPIVHSYGFGFGPTSLSVYQFTAPTKTKSVLTKEQTGAPAPKSFAQDFFSIVMVGRLNAGDAVVLAGTAVVCRISRGAAFPGILGISCGLTSHGTYTVAIDSSGASLRKVGSVTPAWLHKHGA